MAASSERKKKNQEQVAKLFGEPRAKQQKLGFLKIDEETQAMKEQVEVEKLHQANGVFLDWVSLSIFRKPIFCCLAWGSPKSLATCSLFFSRFAAEDFIPTKLRLGTRIEILGCVIWKILGFVWAMVVLCVFVDSNFCCDSAIRFAFF